MPNDLDERLAREQAQHHPPSWATMFDHADPPLFEDPPLEPSRNSSAARIARRRQLQEQAAQQDRDLALIERVAQDQKDDEHLDLALLRLRQGRKVPNRALPGAVRAAQRQGHEHVSTAAQLAAAYLKGS
jgi:hypothetical protein